MPTGNEAGFPRPAVVVTAQEILQREPTVIQVVPLASTIRGFGSEVLIPSQGSGLDHDSSAQCQHLRSVSASRIIRRRGNIGSVDLLRLREVIALILDIGT